MRGDETRASGLSAAEREALAKIIRPWTRCDDGGRFDHGSDRAADAILASDWLAAYVAARATASAEGIAAAKAAALREAGRDWPIGVCAHRCFREDEHIAPRECLYGPDWIADRADRIEAAAQTPAARGRPMTAETSAVERVQAVAVEVLGEHLAVEDGIHSDYFGPPMRWLTCSCKKWRSAKAKNYWSPSELPPQHRAHVAAVLAEALVREGLVVGDE